LKKSVKQENAKRILYSVVVLALCFVTLFTFWKQNNDKNNSLVQEKTETTSETEARREIEVNTPITNVPDEREEETITTTTAPILTVEFSFPLKDSIIKEFSRDELVKNNTTGDWRIHKGIDIKGASGDRINAIDDGTVTELTHNALWGTTVTVDHGNGFEAKYYGLRKDSTVKPGDEVKKNGKIGLLDEIPLEKDDGIHLHLELYKDGVAVSPSDYLGKSVDIS
jgi:murein DD-endopeptidase MepM/ murein hydrolase activator NlpD